MILRVLVTGSQPWPWPPVIHRALDETRLNGRAWYAYGQAA